MGKIRKLIVVNGYVTGAHIGYNVVVIQNQTMSIIKVKYEAIPVIKHHVTKACRGNVGKNLYVFKFDIKYS
jgi:hypothetical protein